MTLFLHSCRFSLGSIPLVSQATSDLLLMLFDHYLCKSVCHFIFAIRVPCMLQLYIVNFQLTRIFKIAYMWSVEIIFLNYGRKKVLLVWIPVLYTGILVYKLFGDKCIYVLCWVVLQRNFRTALFSIIILKIRLPLFRNTYDKA